MKQIRRDIQAVDGPGAVKLVPEEAEDLWSVYNLVCAGDRVTAATVRKVQRETAAGAHRDAERVRLTLRLQVEAVDYDSAAAVLRVRGKNEMETEHVRVGAFHTLELDLQRPFTLAKDVWDSVALDALARACNPAASADLAVLLIQEGLANLLLVGASLTTARARVETSIARKRGPAIAGYERTLNRFFENVLQALLRHCDFGVVRCLVIAGPGFTKEQFHRFLLLEAERRALRQVIENKARIVLAPASSGYRHSLGEVLNAPAVMAMIKDTKAAQEVRALREFHEMMSNEPARACYGPKHVALAQEQLAVQSLLITDELFRNADLPSRKRYVDLVESVKNAGGAVHVFSSMHVSGEQLQQLSGIAAVLRFPMPELEDLEM